MTLEQVQERLRAFREDRAWTRFHNPKDLAAAVAIEAAELQELFLWVPPDDSRNRVEEKRPAVEAELADVLILCLNFADAAEIDVWAAVERKIDDNERRYPVDKSRGRATKYSDL